jgi:hypothetical protein
MLSIAPSPTIYLHSGATDMRKSFDGLDRVGSPVPGDMRVYEQGASPQAASR